MCETTAQPKPHPCRAKAQFCSVNDQPTSSVLCRVAHGQHYITQQAKRTAEAPRAVQELFFEIELLRSTVKFAKWDHRGLLYK